MKSPWFKASELVVGVLLTLVTGALSARADEPDLDARDRARTHFEAGTAAFAAGRVEEACGELQAARDLVTTPVTAWNASLCWERLGRPELAHAALDGVDAGPGGADVSARRTALQRRLAEASAPTATPGASPEPETREFEEASSDAGSDLGPRPAPGHASSSMVAPTPTNGPIEGVTASTERATAERALSASHDPSPRADDTALHWLVAGALILAGGALATTIATTAVRPDEPIGLQVATLSLGF